MCGSFRDHRMGGIADIYSNLPPPRPPSYLHTSPKHITAISSNAEVGEYLQDGTRELRLSSYSNDTAG